MPDLPRRPVGRPPAAPPTAMAPPEAPAPAPTAWSSDAPKRVLKDALHWTHGVPAIAAAHGEALSAHGLELVRRVLGEKYQESQGGPPASPLAAQVADKVGDANYLNRVGDEQHAQEHAGLNAGGQAPS